MRIAGSRRGGILMGLMVTALGLVCLAIVIGFSIARNIRVENRNHNGNEDVSIETPAGNFSIHAHPGRGAAALDIPPYPGARHKYKSGGGASFEWTSKNGEETGLSVAGDEMVTEDSPDKVIDFYKSADPNWMIAEKRGGEIKLELDRDGYKRFIGIKEKSDGTHIGVASIGSPAAN